VISRETRANQRSKILGLLIAARGDWVSLLSIKECGAQYNARIFELRRLGFGIENKIRDVEGKRCSWFRLESSPERSPNIQGAVEGAPGTKQAPRDSFPEFGRLAPERYGVD
jgi:hypothetical protein